MSCSEFACASSGVFSICPLTSDVEEENCAGMNDTISEVEMEHCASAVAPRCCLLSPKDNTDDYCSETISNSNFGSSSEPTDQNGLSTGSSKDLRRDRKQKMFENESEMTDSGSFPWNDSDDDFRESVYDIPLSQRIHRTWDNGLFSKSGHIVSNNIQPAEMCMEVPAQNEFSSEHDSAKLPFASRSQSPHVSKHPADNVDVHNLIDSFFDDLPARRDDQNKLNCGETSSRNACKKKKFPEPKHASSKKYQSSTLSSSITDPYLPQSTLIAGGFNNEIQADSSLDVFASMLDGPADDIFTSSTKRHCNKAKDSKMAASSSNDIAGAGAEGTSSQRRYRRKRQINHDDYVFDETFDVVDKQAEVVSQSHRSRFSTVGRTTDTTVADGLVCPTTLSNLKPRKEKLNSSDVSAVHSGSLSNAHETSAEDADGVSVTRKRLRDADSKRKYQFKKTAGTDRSHSATVSDVLAEYARSESVVASKKEKSKLCLSSSVGSSNGSSNDNQEPTVSSDLAGASAASLLFNQTASQFQPHAAVDNSHDLASHGNVNAQDKPDGHHMVRNRFRAVSRDIADDHTRNAAVSNNGSRKEHLRIMRSRLENCTRRILYDSDDDDDDDNNRFESRNIDSSNTHNAAAIDSSHEDLPTCSGVNVQDTSSNHHMVRNTGSRFRADSRGIANDHTPNAAVSNNSYNGSRKEHLKKMKNRLESLSSRMRRLYNSDDDDNDDSDNRFDSSNVAGSNTQTTAESVSNTDDSRSRQGRLRCIISRRRRILDGSDNDDDDDDNENHNEWTVRNHDGTLSQRNTACRGPETAVRRVSSDDDVIVIGSDDEPSADVEPVNEQNLNDVQPKSETESGTPTAQEQNSESTREIFLPRTARITSG